MFSVQWQTLLRHFRK